MAAVTTSLSLADMLSGAVLPSPTHEHHAEGDGVIIGSPSAGPSSPVRRIRSADAFEVVQRLGSGAFGTALLVQHRGSGTRCVIKVIDISSLDAKQVRAALGEVQVLSQLSHPNIVGYYGSFVEGKFLHIVLEHCTGGDLSAAIKAARGRGKRFSQRRVLSWFVQLASALSYVHQQRILHRDLKASNIFLTGPDRVVKLGDFGISKCLERDSSLACTVIGTPYYMSPELVSGERYSYASDVWALGCVLYELCTLRHAFDASNMCALVLTILRGTYPPIDAYYDAQLRELVDHMLQLDPNARPSVYDIVAYPCVRQCIQHVMHDEAAAGASHMAAASHAHDGVDAPPHDEFDHSMLATRDSVALEDSVASSTHRSSVHVSEQMDTGTSRDAMPADDTASPVAGLGPTGAGTESDSDDDVDSTTGAERMLEAAARIRRMSEGAVPSDGQNVAPGPARASIRSDSGTAWSISLRLPNIHIPPPPAENTTANVVDAWEVVRVDEDHSITRASVVEAKLAAQRARAASGLAALAAVSAAAAVAQPESASSSSSSSSSARVGGLPSSRSRSSRVIKRAHSSASRGSPNATPRRPFLLSSAGVYMRTQRKPSAVQVPISPHSRARVAAHTRAALYAPTLTPADDSSAGERLLAREQLHQQEASALPAAAAPVSYSTPDTREAFHRALSLMQRLATPRAPVASEDAAPTRERRASLAHAHEAMTHFAIAHTLSQLLTDAPAVGTASPPRRVRAFSEHELGVETVDAIGTGHIHAASRARAHLLTDTLDAAGAAAMDAAEGVTRALPAAVITTLARVHRASHAPTHVRTVPHASLRVRTDAPASAPVSAPSSTTSSLSSPRARTRRHSTGSSTRLLLATIARSPAAVTTAGTNVDPVSVMEQLTYKIVALRRTCERICGLDVFERVYKQARAGADADVLAAAAVDVGGADALARVQLLCGLEDKLKEVHTRVVVQALRERGLTLSQAEEAGSDDAHSDSDVPPRVHTPPVLARCLTR